MNSSIEVIMNSYIKERNEILYNWTSKEGSSMKDREAQSVFIIDEMRESQIELNQRNVSKVCRLYRGHLLDKKIIHQIGDKIVLSNTKPSSWTKSLSVAASYSSPNGDQGSGHNTIPFVFHTKYNFNEKLGLDLECLKNFNYYPDERKIDMQTPLAPPRKPHTKRPFTTTRDHPATLQQKRAKLPPGRDANMQEGGGDTCECYHESSVLDKDREVILFSSNFILNTNTMKLAFMNAFEEEIQLSFSSDRILQGIEDGSLFKNESWFRFLSFKSLIFYPQQLPEVKEKLINIGYTEDMIANLHIYIRCTVDVVNV